LKTFTKKEIEVFYLKTIQGIYLSKCAENGGEDEKGFYLNQLDEFVAGFECCMPKMEKNDFPKGQDMFEINDAREYLEIFMIEHFKDRSFGNYIWKRLAGDFACELATAIMRTHKDDL